MESRFKMNRLGLTLYLVFWFLIGMCLPARSDEINLDNMIQELLKLNPRHPLLKDEVLRESVLKSFEEQGEKYKLEPSLLVYWAYRESSIRIDKVGSRGEVGIGQFHGIAKSTCKSSELDVLSWDGGIECMAMLIDMGLRYCGSLERGLVWYASGDCRNSKAEPKLKERLRSWKRIVEK